MIALVAIEVAVDVDLRDRRRRRVLELFREVDVVAGDVGVLNDAVDGIEVLADLADRRRDRTGRGVVARAGLVALGARTVEHVAALVVRVAEAPEQVFLVVVHEREPHRLVVEVVLRHRGSLKIERVLLIRRDVVERLPRVGAAVAERVQRAVTEEAVLSLNRVPVARGRDVGRVVLDDAGTADALALRIGIEAVPLREERAHFCVDAHEGGRRDALLVDLDVAVVGVKRPDERGAGDQRDGDVGPRARGGAARRGRGRRAEHVDSRAGLRAETLQAREAVDLARVADVVKALLRRTVAPHELSGWSPACNG